MNIRYYECMFIALGVQHAVRIRLSSVACPSLQYFSKLSHKWNDFRKRVTEHKMCFDFLYNFFFNISHSKKN